MRDAVHRLIRCLSNCCTSISLYFCLAFLAVGAATQLSGIVFIFKSHAVTATVVQIEAKLNEVDHLYGFRNTYEWDLPDGTKQRYAETVWKSPKLHRAAEKVTGRRSESTNEFMSDEVAAFYRSLAATYLLASLLCAAIFLAFNYRESKRYETTQWDNAKLVVRNSFRAIVQAPPRGTALVGIAFVIAGIAPYAFDFVFCEFAQPVDLHVTQVGAQYFDGERFFRYEYSAIFPGRSPMQLQSQTNWMSPALDTMGGTIPGKYLAVVGDLRIGRPAGVGSDVFWIFLVCGGLTLMLSVWQAVCERKVATAQHLSQSD